MSSSPSGGYDPRAVEAEIYQFWQDHGHFHADIDPARKPYVILMPPPNVTGALHLGHALYTIQDVLVRQKRMAGFAALWMPGTDHAGIATQAIVEKRLKEQENLTRNEIGRDELVRRIWKWKDEYEGRILAQLRTVGASPDWRRSRFTLDEVCARAVYHAFFEFFKAGLIYRGTRLVNWDAHLQTAVADDEIEHQTVKGHFWHFRYPILEGTGNGEQGTENGEQGTGIEGLREEAGGRTGSRPHVPTFTPMQPVPPEIAVDAVARAAREGAQLGVDYMVVATTRPETMLGDTAVCVHPDDPRYQHVIGRHVLLPLQNRAIPIIADPLLAKMELGSGCVKVTPGHDPKDYECGLRNKLPMINLLEKDGSLNENAGAYRGQDRFVARKRVVADLEALGLVDKIEDYETEIGHSDRSKTPIEPMLSEQWFVKMDKLAELAMESVRDGRVQFHPGRYAKSYLDWLGEKRDWCISRQLWWGHRIPVWTLPLNTGPWAKQRDRKFDSRNWADSYLKELSEAERDAVHLQIMPDPGREALVFLACVRPGWPSVEAKLESLGWQRDPDVLDTWFSSALWPLNTLGWPFENRDEGTPRPPASVPSSLRPSVPSSADFDYFFPSDVLCTGRGIISLWVARMVLFSLAFDQRGELNFRGRAPFSHVYINPTIQDGQGRVMSKSLGNGVDPLDIVHLYGADALRFSMTALCGDTQDIRIPVAYSCPHCQHLTEQSQVVPKGKFPYQVTQVTCSSCRKPFATQWADEATKSSLGVARESSERFELGRNFVNKIWQAATGFVLPNVNDVRIERGPAGYHTRRPPAEGDLFDRWIRARLIHCIRRVDEALASYQFQRLCDELRTFFWNEFCDWYLEEAKVRLQRDDANDVKVCMLQVLDLALCLLHPIMPFVTEAIWQRIGQAVPRHHELIWPGGEALPAAAPALIRAPWPADWSEIRPEWETEVGDVLQPVVRALRDSLVSINTSRAAAKQPARGKLPSAVIRAEPRLAQLLSEHKATLLRLGRCEAVEIGSDRPKPPESTSRVLAGIEVFVPVAGLIDLDAERKRLRKEIEDVAGHTQRLRDKLSNDGFVAKAPVAVVEKERERLAELESRGAALRHNLEQLGE